MSAVVPLPAASDRNAGVRRRLALAALDLFLTKGFDETRVEEVAEAAGVSRRTAFRHSRTKEDLVFPDHEDRRAMLAQQLDESDPDIPALEVVRQGAELAIESFIADPALVLRRFELVRVVAPVREREVAEISLYEALIRGFLRRRWAGEPDGELRASVAAAAVVAAHNHVLRQWLTRGGDYDPTDEAREAFRFIIRAFNPPDEPVIDHSARDAEPEVVLAVMRGDQVADAVREFAKLLETRGSSPAP
jgi:AcrR family transcriptional regulator